MNRANAPGFPAGEMNWRLAGLTVRFDMRQNFKVEVAWDTSSSAVDLVRGCGALLTAYNSSYQ